MQVYERLWIYEDTNAIEVIYPIALLWLTIETNVVAQAEASSALQAETHACLLRRDILLGHRRADLCESALSDLNGLHIRACILRADYGTCDGCAHRIGISARLCGYAALALFPLLVQR